MSRHRWKRWSSEAERWAGLRTAGYIPVSGKCGLQLREVGQSTEACPINVLQFISDNDAVKSHQRHSSLAQTASDTQLGKPQ